MFFRLIFLILFLIIGILFTLGYNLFSIINFKNKLYNGEIFIDNMNIIDTETNETTNYKYNDLDINSNYKLILTYLYYGCIVTSCLIGAGIVFSYLRCSRARRCATALSISACVNVFSAGSVVESVTVVSVTSLSTISSLMLVPH